MPIDSLMDASLFRHKVFPVEASIAEINLSGARCIQPRRKQQDYTSSANVVVKREWIIR